MGRRSDRGAAMHTQVTKLSVQSMIFFLSFPFCTKWELATPTLRICNSVPCVVSVEEVFWDAAAGLGDAVPVAVAEDLFHRVRPHGLPQPRLVMEGTDVSVAHKITLFRRSAQQSCDRVSSWVACNPTHSFERALPLIWGTLEMRNKTSWIKKEKTRFSYSLIWWGCMLRFWTPIPTLSDRQSGSS